MFLQTSDLAGPEFEPTLQTSTVELKRSACVFCFVAGCANTVRTSSISYTYDETTARLIVGGGCRLLACVYHNVFGGFLHTCSIQRTMHVVYVCTLHSAHGYDDA